MTDPKSVEYNENETYFVEYNDNDPNFSDDEDINFNIVSRNINLVLFQLQSMIEHEDEDTESFIVDNYKILLKSQEQIDKSTWEFIQNYIDKKTRETQTQTRPLEKTFEANQLHAKFVRNALAPNTAGGAKKK